MAEDRVGMVSDEAYRVAYADGVADERAEWVARIEALAESLEAVQVPCTGPGCPGCTAGRLRALLAEERAR